MADIAGRKFVVPDGTRSRNLAQGPEPRQAEGSRRAWYSSTRRCVGLGPARNYLLRRRPPTGPIG